MTIEILPQTDLAPSTGAISASAEVPDPAVELSIVMPCLNEAETLAGCIDQARAYLETAGIRGEIIIGDNGSLDGSQDIARRHGARVVDVTVRGYGAAIHQASLAARGRYIIVGDSDGSYDFGALTPFLRELRAGCDLAMGNRFKGGIREGAMPWKNRYIGNPILTGIGRLFFRSRLGDFHCGLRGYSAAAYRQMDLQTTGMEFASEMVIKATLLEMKIVEVPCTLSPDGRSRPPHLRPWRDGWRHLRFMALYSPRWLFLFPGFFLILLGLGGYGIAMPGLVVGGVGFSVNTLLFASLFILMGYQSIVFGFLSRTFAMTERLLPAKPSLVRFQKRMNLERGLLYGCGAFGMAAILLGVAVNEWRLADFGALDFERVARLVVPGVTLAALGFQTILMSFFLSMMGLKRR